MDALPNLHAAVLHFPIVLLPLALACEILGLARPSAIALERLAAAAWALVAVAVAAAFMAGRSAADGLVDVPPSAQLALSQHADAAWFLLLAVVPVAVLRLAALRLAGRVRLVTRVVSAVFGIPLLFQLVTTADRGGALVYRHALAVQLPPPPACPSCEAPPEGTDASSRWQTSPDGTATWEPTAGDLGAGVVRLVGTAHEVDGEGLTVRAEGRTLLLVPGSWGDVQVNASLQLHDFEGTLGVVHHVANPTRYEAFTVTTTGVARLAQFDETGSSTLHEATWSPSPGAVLSVSAAGSHLKGLVDGKVVNHGHAPAPPDGEVGLLLDGIGSVGIRNVEIIPLKNH